MPALTNKDKILVTGDFDIPPQLMSERVVHLRAPRNDQDIVDHLAGVRHYVVGGPEYVHDKIMAAAADLKHVVVMGTGTNSFVDVKAAQSRGISVDNTPGINADAVAEFALSMVIANLANSFYSQHNLLEGGWYQKPHKTLSEATVGIVGLGNIGRKLASKIRAVSPANILYNSRTRKPDQEQQLGIKYAELPKMSAECDALILCITYTPQTHHIVNASILDDMKESAILLNFSNPLTVDPVALKDGLNHNRPRFAYFDGYYNEWIGNKGSEHDDFGLLQLGPHKFVATSHIAAQAHGVISEILTQAFTKIEVWGIDGEQNAPRVAGCRERVCRQDGGNGAKPFPN